MADHSGPGHPRTLRVTSPCVTRDEFIESFRPLCDADSIFVPSKTPCAGGERVRIELTLTGGEVVLGGLGRIGVSYREPGGPFGRAGMRIHFEELTAEGRALLDDMGLAESAPPPTLKISKIDDDGEPAATVATPVAAWDCTTVWHCTLDEHHLASPRLVRRDSRETRKLEPVVVTGDLRPRGMLRWVALPALLVAFCLGRATTSSPASGAPAAKTTVALAAPQAPAVAPLPAPATAPSPPAATPPEAPAEEIAQPVLVSGTSAEPTAPLCRLEVRTDPDGATVTVDNGTVGLTPLEVELACGSHRVVVQRKRWTPISRTIELEPGQTRTLRASRRRQPPAPTRPAGWELPGARQPF